MYFSPFAWKIKQMDIGTPAFKVRSKTAYFSNASLTARPTFGRV